MKTYSKLEERFEYDKEQATELAEAMTELLEVERRAAYLREVVSRHKKLKKFMWGTQTGKVLAIHDIPDDHLKNILNYLPNNNRQISPQLKAEARSRGFEVTSDNGLAPLMISAQGKEFVDIDEDYYPENDD